jgi:hypothetical protein
MNFHATRSIQLWGKLGYICNLKGEHIVNVTLKLHITMKKKNICLHINSCLKCVL